jgi:hypothetical protein
VQKETKLRKEKREKAQQRFEEVIALFGSEKMSVKKVTECWKISPTNSISGKINKQFLQCCCTWLALLSPLNSSSNLMQMPNSPTFLSCWTPEANFFNQRK